jgi:DNA-binding MarR family transcriptional regulator
LGALALVVSDEVGRRVLATSLAPSITDASAVSALGQFLDGATIDMVHRVLGVTPSGAVRLVDRLAEADLVSRESGPDKRSRAIRLTADGHRQADLVGGTRSAYLLELTANLSPVEVDLLRDLLGRVMAAVVSHKDGGAWTCRLCDLAACRRAQGECPTYNAAAGRAADDS